MEKFEHFRHIFLFELTVGAKAVEAAKNICAVCENNVIREGTARKWFSRFKKDCFDINDTPRSGRLSGFDEDRLNTSIHNDPRQCIQELANLMNCDHSPSRKICIQWVRFKNLCMGTACSKPNPQKPVVGHMCISARSSSIGS